MLGYCGHSDAHMRSPTTMNWEKMFPGKCIYHFLVAVQGHDEHWSKGTKINSDFNRIILTLYKVMRFNFYLRWNVYVPRYEDPRFWFLKAENNTGAPKFVSLESLQENTADLEKILPPIKTFLKGNQINSKTCHILP